MRTTIQNIRVLKSMIGHNLKLRKQRHDWSCGLACVAMIADKPYNTVIADFENMYDTLYWNYLNKSKQWVIGYGTSTSDLYDLFTEYGVTSNQRMIRYKGRDALPELSILAINERDEIVNWRKARCWHWVVCKREGRKFKIFDPWDGVRSLQSLGRTIESYIRIHT